MTTIISKDIKKAAEALLAGEVIGMPTETVYGLAGAINSSEAINKIYAIKERPLSNPLIVHIAHIDHLSTVACNVPDAAYKLAESFWPGPLTIILPKNPNVSNLLTAGMDTVAVRIPNHPTALELLNEVKVPIAAPSANPFGRISPTTSQHVLSYFSGVIPLILEGGPCEVGIESTIIGFENEETILYRYGNVTPESIQKIMRNIKIQVHTKDSPKAPGMLLRHYSPATPMCFTDDPAGEIKRNYGKRIGVIRFTSGESYKNIIADKILSQSGSIEEAAANLYAGLHIMDNIGLDVIIAEKFPEHGIGVAINDKLFRASQMGAKKEEERQVL